MIASGALLYLHLLISQAAEGVPPEVTPPPATETAPPAPAPATEPAPPTPPPRRPPPRPATPTPPPAAAASPFRLALTYTRVLREDGDPGLANPDMSTNAVGIDMAFPSNNYVRNHLGLAHQWESMGPYSARGFRIDLISLGYPIPLVSTPSFRLDLEPILTILRGEIMWTDGGNRFLRVESGFGLELSATFRRWFVALQPLAIDFRYWVWGFGESVTGFTRVFPLRVAIGHEF
jgi:hypothetical protein